VLVCVDQVLEEFRAGFFGKASLVHFFRGSFDMAVTRLSGRRRRRVRPRPASPIMCARRLFARSQ
jgi:hypothetical protein